MTLPDERARAVLEMGRAASQLVPYAHRRSANPRVPRELLSRVARALRHYPLDVDIADTILVVDSLPVFATESKPQQEM